MRLGHFYPTCTFLKASNDVFESLRPVHMLWLLVLIEGTTILGAVS